jgi:hypothetical protein
MHSKTSTAVIRTSMPCRSERDLPVVEPFIVEVRRRPDAPEAHMHRATFGASCAVVARAASQGRIEG